MGRSELMVHLEEQYVALPIVRGVSHGSASLECGHRRLAGQLLL